MPVRSLRRGFAAGLTGLLAVALAPAAMAADHAADVAAAGTNLASNPVLASNAQGWGVLSGGTGSRVAVSDHPGASYAFQVQLSSSTAGIYLPQLAVSAGTAYTVAVDAKTAGTARMQIDWYDASGFLTTSTGPEITTHASGWTHVSATVTAPAGATNSHPLEYVTGGSGTWQSTAADFEQATSPGGGTAAGNYGWGTPLPQSDEFNYTGAPDSSKWEVYGQGGSTGGAGSNCGPGNAGNGRRCASANHVANGYLRQTGSANGDTAGLASTLGQRYGRWEVRARVSAASGATGHPYHPVLITWPDSDQWPQGGEYDFFEVNVGDTAATAFMHHPTQSGVVQDEYHSGSLDLSQWHNYGFEWSSSGLTGYLDGVAWFHDTDPDVQAPGPMHLTIQLDNFFGSSGMQQAYLDIDWARVYPL